MDPREALEAIAGSTAPPGAVDLGWGHAHLRAGAPHLEADSRVVVTTWPPREAEVLATVERAMGDLAQRRVEVWAPWPDGAGALDALARAVPGPARADETVLVLPADRPSPADLAAAGAAVRDVAGTAEVRPLSPAVTQVAVTAAGLTVALCHLQGGGGSGPAEVEGVQTVPAWRNRGLAGAVVVLAAAHARRTGARPVWLRTTRDGPAERLYRRLGFTPVGVVATLRWAPVGPR